VGGAVRRRSGRDLTLAERVMVSVWLRDTRQALKANLSKYDEPFSGPELLDARFMPNGPARTQPFRNLIRNVMNRPATWGDHAYCKIPSIYEQGHRRWGQYDGSIASRLERSVLAAVAIGATPDNLVIPEISRSVVAAVDYTVTLRAPSYASAFPAEAAKVDAAAARRGREVYRAHCQGCHGARDAVTGAWEDGARTGEVIPVEEIGTDPERVRFRHFSELPDALYQFFPEGHPLRPRREDIRPGPAGTTAGFISAPLEAPWARAPYLHNGSVPTLAQLINLEERQGVFYRGRNLYDPVEVGLRAPGAPDARNYYRFDTSVRGNSNRGHDYPWAYGSPQRDQQQLKDLLEYLKTAE
jgi:mono/diheme cytochrome c family protein